MNVGVATLQAWTEATLAHTSKWQIRSYQCLSCDWLHNIALGWSSTGRPNLHSFRYVYIACLSIGLYICLHCESSSLMFVMHDAKVHIIYACCLRQVHVQGWILCVLTWCIYELSSSMVSMHKVHAREIKKCWSSLLLKLQLWFSVCPCGQSYLV